MLCTLLSGVAMDVHANSLQLCRAYTCLLLVQLPWADGGLLWVVLVAWRHPLFGKRGHASVDVGKELCNEMREFVTLRGRFPKRAKKQSADEESSLAQRWAKLLVKSKGSVGALREQYTELFEEEDCQSNSFEFFVLRIASLQ